MLSISFDISFSTMPVFLYIQKVPEKMDTYLLIFFKNISTV